MCVCPARAFCLGATRHRRRRRRRRSFAIVSAPCRFSRTRFSHGPPVVLARLRASPGRTSSFACVCLPPPPPPPPCLSSGRSVARPPATPCTTFVTAAAVSVTTSLRRHTNYRYLLACVLFRLNKNISSSHMPLVCCTLGRVRFSRGRACTDETTTLRAFGDFVSKTRVRWFSCALCSLLVRSPFRCVPWRTPVARYVFTDRSPAKIFWQSACLVCLTITTTKCTTTTITNYCRVL